MRVAVLTNDFPPHGWGGAARVAAEQAEMLERLGFEVRVWSPQIDWFRFGALRRLSHHLRDLGPRHDLVKEIAAWRPDTLISHNLTGVGFGTPAAIQGGGVRWIHILHDVQMFEPSGRLRYPWFWWWWHAIWARLRRRAFGRPDLILSPTRWLLDQHVKRGLFKNVEMQVLPNPAPPIDLDARAREPHRPFRLLYVGRVSADKGARLLSRLAKTIYYPYELRIVGDGPLSGALARRRKRYRVVLYGLLTSEQVRAEMRQADVLLVPSQIEENQPTVILEAASVGLPVIASAVGGIPETLDDPLALVPPNMIDAWHTALNRLHDRWEFYRQAVDRVIMLARRHDPEAYAQRLASFVRSKT